MKRYRILTLIFLFSAAIAHADGYVISTGSGSYHFDYPSVSSPNQAFAPNVRTSGVACGANQAEGYGCNFIGGGEYNQLRDQAHVAADAQISAYRGELAAALAKQDTQVSPDGVIPELQSLKDKTVALKNSLESLSKEMTEAHEQYSAHLNQTTQPYRAENDARLKPDAFSRFLMKDNPQLNAFATAMVTNGRSLFPNGVTPPAPGEIPMPPGWTTGLAARLLAAGVGMPGVPDLIELVTGHSISPPFQALSDGERSMAAISIIVSNLDYWKTAAKEAGSFGLALEKDLSVTFGQGRMELLEEVARTGSEFHYYGPMERGLLSDIPANKEGTVMVAETFRSGTYVESVTTEEITLYRVYSREGGELSNYWSRTRPTGPTQATIDVALDPKFNNAATRWVELRVPAGTKLYDGTVAPIFLDHLTLLGNGSQTYIPGRIPSTWKYITGTF